MSTGTAPATHRARGGHPQARKPVDIDSLASRAEALSTFVHAVDGIVPDERLLAAREFLERAGQRLTLSGRHTVVALAGATGSGKSSLFNAISGMRLSVVGSRRPTTGVVHACVWGANGAVPLLDWLRVPVERRFARESQLDGQDEARLRGLVLLDLPDFDSIVWEHRDEADRLLALADLVVWVTDPQKYADQVIHQRYLRSFHRHRDSTVVVLNQADRLGPVDTGRCLADLRQLLDADGLADVPVLATSAVDEAPEVDDLRKALYAAILARRAALGRLDADLSEIVDGIADLVTGEVGQLGWAGGRGMEGAPRSATVLLVEELAMAVGLPAIAAEAELAYRRRAAEWLRWPPARLLYRHREPAEPPEPDDEDDLFDDGPDTDRPPVPPASAEKTPAGESAGTQPARARLAMRTFAGQLAGELAEPWQAAVYAVARSRLEELTVSLERAVSRTDLTEPGPSWWRLGVMAQSVLAAVGAAGLVWLNVLLYRLARDQDAPALTFGSVAPPILLLLFGAGCGLLLSLVHQPLARFSGRKARVRATRKLRRVVAELARDMVVEPVRVVIDRYDQAKAALIAAGGEPPGQADAG
ncbi:MAG: 50S ribosome-binding GTPase [Micromonosporaceae bacterium]|nr:50S ribosome-binding GTPase [Micromonosporaceae bacterium]